MRVVFRKMKRELCQWTAFPTHRRPVTCFGGGPIGRGLPHDLAQFVVERELEHRYGFWGCLSDGATFRSLVKAGRRRTEKGRAIIAEHLGELEAAEQDAHFHCRAWLEGRPTPLGPTLEALREQWLALPEGASLELDFRPLAHRRSARS